jgi:guanyl-specific ribonuclease Sa
MKRLLRPALIVLAVLGIAWWLQGTAPDAALRGQGADAPSTPSLPAFLPPEAAPVLSAIERGGPFEYRKDGTVFQNREGLLPRQPRGYYREFTVETPGSPDRGARRIVTGGDPPVEFWYTDDHYRSFRRFEMPQAPR